MTFISFAQNLEDVILYRALKHIDAGFYVDVGAHDPILHSVTKAFYDRGWHGINIEPVSYWHKRLIKNRPKDINLQVAASNVEGVLRFFEVADTGLSTTEAEFAKRHADAGYGVSECEVRCRRLDDICDDYGVKDIHFLKVDVEGAEASVLDGMSFERCRPWIVVVEATEPLQQTSTHEKWEHLLTNKRYFYVYFDGLNRFYVAEEHAELRGAFYAPPNVFDDYVRHLELATQNRPKRLQDRVHKKLRRYRKRLNSVWSKLTHS